MWNRSENKINCIFIRHGCTVSNREHRYLGRTDEPLDEVGVSELKNALNNGVYKTFYIPLFMVSARTGRLNLSI